MKLAIVSLMTGVPWGGSEELWAAAAREALARGWNVEAYLPEWPSVPERVSDLAKRGLAVSYWKQYDPSLKARIASKVFHRSADLVRQVQQSSADAIVLSLGSAFNLSGYQGLCDFLRTTPKRFVLVVQHNYETPLRPWEKARVAGIYERAASVVFVSERNRRTAERQLATRIPNALVLQNPVNLPSFDAVPWPDAAGGFPTFACVARLEVWAKGQDVLLEALAEPEWKPRDWRLSLFGEGPDREYLTTLAKMYGIMDKVTFAGQARDMREVWTGQEMLVLPSRSEGTPLSLVEAQIAGRPAIVTDVGDSARWAIEGETGFVADAATTTSFGKALTRAWENRGHWKQMGERAHDSAASRVDRNPGTTLLNHVQATCGT